MLYLPLFLSLILLILANRSARRPDLRIGVFVLCGVGFIVVPVGLGIIFPPVAILFLFLFFTLLVRYGFRRRQWRFLPLSLAAFTVSPRPSALSRRRRLSSQTLPRTRPAPRRDSSGGPAPTSIPRPWRLSSLSAA